MNKRILGWLAILAIGGLVALSIYCYSQYDAPMTEADSAQAKAEILKHLQSNSTPESPVVLAKNTPVRLAIGTLGLDEQRERRISDILTSELSSARGLELIERRALEAALQEVAMSLSGVVRAKDAIRLGKLVRADWFLLGTAHNFSGTNHIVARIVNARSGIVHDIGLFTVGDDHRTIKELAAFVNQCRQTASGAKPHTYVALGSFTDMSVNERFPEFPDQLRAYLTAKFQGANLSLLEREQVEALLQEVRLDLAGLTDDGTESVVPAQFAYWLADGYFQSFETTVQEVEVILRVTRILDTTHMKSLHGKPGVELFDKIRAEIEETIAAEKNSIAFAPTRRREIKEQLGMGKDLLTIATGNGYEMFAHQSPRQRRRNLEEARKAFEAVLLLDSENREAKICLANCLGDPVIGRLAEATNMLSEVISSQVTDRWSHLAQNALEMLYFNEDRSKGVRPRIWPARQADPEVKRLPTPAELALAQKELLQDIEATRHRLSENNDCDDSNYGFNSISKIFGTNYLEEAADAASKMLPVVTDKFPDMAPYAMAAAMTVQTRTNAAVVTEFRRALQQWSDNPEAILCGPAFFKQVTVNVFNWFYDRQAYAEAAEMITAKYRAAALSPKITFNPEDKMRMAFVLFKQKDYAGALSLFEEPGRIPMEMTYRGPWGNRMFVRLFPASFADSCRKEMGLVAEPHPEEFALGNPVLTVDENAVLGNDADTLWLTTGGKLLQIDADLNVITDLPVEDFSTALFVSSQTVWIGTANRGIIQYDRATGKTTRINKNDGLLLDNIRCLMGQNGKLWIGYGTDENAGGLSYLDLQSRTVRSFPTPLGYDPAKLRVDPPSSAPRHAVCDIVPISGIDVSINVDGFGWRQYHTAKDTWEGFSGPSVLSVSVAQGDSQRLIVGGNIPSISTVVGIPFQGSAADHDVFVSISATELAVLTANKVKTKGEYGRDFGSGAVAFLTNSGSNWEVMSDGRLISMPTQVISHGNSLWVIGKPYLAMFDLSTKKLSHICFVCPDEVNRIAFAGGCLWATWHGGLYRLRF